MKICFFAKRVTSSLLFAALFCISSLATAELRVIVEYDETGHKLVRAVDLGPAKQYPVSDHVDPTKGNNVSNGNSNFSPANRVTLRWMRADGTLISTDSVVDPRITHAPLLGSNQAPKVVGLSSGAYVVTGPSESAFLEIELPTNPLLGLDAQIWRIELKP